MKEGILSWPHIKIGARWFFFNNNHQLQYGRIVLHPLFILFCHFVIDSCLVVSSLNFYGRVVQELYIILSYFEALPNRMYARILQHISAVEVEKNAPNHDHLPAVCPPAVVHSFKEHLTIHRFGQELFYIGFHMSFY